MAPKTPSLSDRILEWDQHICAYCGVDTANQADHVVPKKYHGPDHENNLVASCRSCNVRKSGYLAVEYIAMGFYRIVQRSGIQALDWVVEWSDDKYLSFGITARTVVEKSKSEEPLENIVATPVVRRTFAPAKQLLNRCVQCNKFFLKDGKSKCEKCRV